MQGSWSRLGRMLLAVLVAAALLPGVGATALAGELFFSEYVEGSGYNKALEIYNATGAAVDLAAGGYDVQISFNGGTFLLTVNLVGTIANGEVFVLAQDHPDSAITGLADQLDPANFFNGDDAVLLRRNGLVIDAIGQLGFDPGSYWGVEPTTTQNHSLRRLPAVCAGDTDAADPFDPALQWASHPQDTFDGLGAHISDCLLPPPPAGPVINEFSASTVGTDVEYVEVYGVPSTDYSAYTVLEIEGDFGGTGIIDEVIAVGTTDADGFWLANLAPDSLENGTLTLLLVEGFSGSLGQDLDFSNNGILGLTPWLALVDAVAVNDGGAGDRTYGVPSLGVAYDGLAFAPGGASRLPDGVDTDTAADWVRNDFDLAGIPPHAGTPDFGEAINTPGEPNEAVPEACGDTYTPIYEVQGSGLASLLAGADVAVEGVVGAAFQDVGGLDGYFLQDPAGDGNAATSDGIFVYAPGGTAVNAGDGLRVRGTVREADGRTEVVAATVWACSTSNALTPATLTLPVTGLDYLETLEGMLVTMPQALVISEYYDFDRYGEIVLGTTRQYQPTAVYEPGSAEATGLAAANLLRRITLDDGRNAENPDPARHPNGGVFDLGNRFRGGDTVTGVTGALDYSSGKYRIQPTQGAAYTAANPRPATPAAVGGTLKVASFNVMNYFTTLGSRGASDAAEFTRQRTKIFAALAALDADVVGLVEIENNSAAIADLVAGLNGVVGAGTYAYIDTGVIGIDEIKVALIYRPATVTPLGAYAILDSTVDARFLDTKNRPVLAQTFQYNADGEIFTVAVNHLKSKGSDCNDVGDPDLGDGAGNCNLTRTAGAEAMVDWLAADPTGSGDGDFLIIGDLNSYDKEDPVDALVAGGYTDLLALYQGEFAYSYVFDGQLGYLDYALAGAGLVGEITGVAVWHSNADEPDLLDYDMTFKQPAQDALYEPNAYRSSDHDAIVVGLHLTDLVPPPQQMSFRSIGGEDGWVLESGEDTTKGSDTLDATSTTGRIGDDDENRQYRAILSFDTSGLPEGAVVTGITLKIKKQGLTGANPFDFSNPNQKNGLNLLKVDLQAGYYHDDPTLERFDFHAVGSRGNVGRFIKTATKRWLRAPLRAASYSLLNLDGVTQFRLRFDLDDNDDLTADYLRFYTGDAAEADRPELIVDYYVPFP
ncbi:MAG: ExeM/NucH family extracellular endonuclease [Acidimicrobiia bacterium]|nr:ExeM/NucH family extracellular endonuclease [Acidimicrobiia bacterium]